MSASLLLQQSAPISHTSPPPAEEEGEEGEGRRGEEGEGEGGWGGEDGRGEEGEVGMGEGRMGEWEKGGEGGERGGYTIRTTVSVEIGPSPMTKSVFSPSVCKLSL